MRHLLRFLPHRADGARPPEAAPTDPATAVAARHRAERRAVARRLHPDLGGDVDADLAALAEVDRRYDPAPDGGPGGDHVTGRSPRRPRRSGLRRRVNRAARATRQRLPRRAPGARRYARL